MSRRLLSTNHESPGFSRGERQEKSSTASIRNAAQTIENPGCAATGVQDIGNGSSFRYFSSPDCAGWIG